MSVSADSQRLIYCGRVLQDDKKLNDYSKKLCSFTIVYVSLKLCNKLIIYNLDVNGKVIHLVQRAPPQPGQRGNDGGQNPGFQGSQNSQRTQYRLTRAQMHGNAMYLGTTMAVPAEIVEGHGTEINILV